MSRICNNFSLVGRIGNDPTLETTKNGKTMMAISLAVAQRKYDSKTSKYVNSTQWFRFVLWEKQAEALSKVLKKGLRIGVAGSLDPVSYEREDGKKQTSLNLKVDDIELLFDAKLKTDSESESEIVDEVE